MNKLLQNKKLEINICTFISFVVAIGIIGSYFVIFQLGNLQKDLSTMKLITYIPLFLLSVYSFVFSVKNKENGVKSVLLGIMAISLLVIVESFFGALSTDLNGRMIFKFLGEAFSAIFVFMLMDSFYLTKAMVCRVWYWILSCVCLILPAIFICLYWLESTREYVMEGYVLSIYTLHSAVLVYALIAIVLDSIILVKKNAVQISKFAIWSNFVYAVALACFSLLSILNIVFQGSGWVHLVDALRLLSDVGLLMILIASVKKYDINTTKTIKKRK